MPRLLSLEGHPTNGTQTMKRLLKILGRGVVVTFLAKRGRRSADVYLAEVSAGARPIEAVGTSVAAFVGLQPGK